MAETDTPYTAVATATPVPPSKEEFCDGTGGVITRVPAEYNVLPETQGLTWADRFFDNETGVVAVFDFDYEQMEDFQFKVTAASQAACCVCHTVYTGPVMTGWLFGSAPLLSFAVGAGVYATQSILSMTPCLMRKQIQWDVLATHVAVTRDGIRFVRDKRKSAWGLPICDKGKISKTVPFDKITDCDVLEPAGAQCCCIPRVLMTVHVDTASSGGDGKRHELHISGLKEPHKFKALVWAMKRSGNLVKYQAPTVMEMVDRGVLGDEKGGNHQSEDVSGLLKDIRDELRQNNELLREMKQKNNNDSSPAVDKGANGGELV